MRAVAKSLLVLAGAMLFSGCIVREEPRPRRVYVYDAPPPAPVEVVPVAPAPDYLWVGGVCVREGGGWAWHRGYWRRR